MAIVIARTASRNIRTSSTLLQCCRVMATVNRRVGLYERGRRCRVNTYKPNVCIVSKRGFNRIVLGRDDQPQITLNDMRKFLTDHELGFLEGFTCLVLDCHLCHLSGRRHVHGRLYINMTTGRFLCLKCGSCGSWDDLATWLALRKAGLKTAPLPRAKDVHPKWSKAMEEMQLLYNGASPMESLDSKEFNAIVSRFGVESIDVKIFAKYEVRVSPDLTQLLLPLHSVSGGRVGLHVISKRNSDLANVVETLPMDLGGVLFGWKQLNKLRHESVIIAGSPLDVLAIAQQKTSAAVSLPHPKSLPLEVLALLEPYNKITLWLGNNIVAWESSKKFARKLNERRCYVVRHQPEPLEALKKGIKLLTIVKSASPLLHSALTTFSSLRKDVFSELAEIEQAAGIKWTRYPALTRILKGHRKGELTVLTGQTGSGKTTFMSEYSLDLCSQGVRSLWGSFEIKNSRLAKTMLTQFSQISLSKHLELYDSYADKFELLPLHFLTFHGAQSIRSVLDAMRHAVYIHDIEHVIIDNLQFMMGTSETTSQSMDRFWKQDVIVSSLRQFATIHNCHVTLAIHPRKESSEELTNMSFYGGAKACQEADNVLILQDKRLLGLRGKKYIQVTKNRFDGDTGIVPLEFDKQTLSFAGKRKPKEMDAGSQETAVDSVSRRR